MDVDYLSADRVKRIIGDLDTPTYGRSASGYGSKIPTRWTIELVKGGIRRVYMMQYGNSGTPYVIIAGKEYGVESLLP